jgi:hypothetical protein
MPTRRRDDDGEDDEPRPRRRRADDDGDEDDDHPARRRKKKPASGDSRKYMIAGLIGVGALVLLCAGCGLAAYLLDFLPVGHPGKRADVTFEFTQKVTLGTTIQEVENRLGTPGYPIPESEWSSVSVASGPRGGARSLADWARDVGGGEPVTKWYQWGSGSNRLFVGTSTDDRGNEIAVVMAAEWKSDGGSGTTSGARGIPRRGGWK